jgi:hypothetical protein
MNHINGRQRNPGQIQLTLGGEAEEATGMRRETQPTRPCREGWMRIYFQNVNGIKYMAKEWEEMMKNIATNQVGIFGLAETNFNLTPISTKICVNRAKAAIRRELGKRENVTLQTSSCKG